ncbi:acetate--CoA ligase [Paenarthrobacter ureafaciens]|uniref:acetate--CoA ligase n=1 Tax=Paenarthrobacter ureafaciens TaxID=37931 RepID=UPI0009AD61D9|nr:acetate--CoA ligase [Paenarthrobacter ureafaciens]NWL27281.1 acetate--CoA ligase [Paenarthrobacter ureafaciens]QSZ52873.1 acetyl-coenzyme A synthetase [Paenarthrobacter ureafaciens]GLU59414.1 acetyl-coenzyme A synthetase [Paenarthrobacter ureafaciens]GLU63849.1 acetyl-coenzyme A synthetase [Paenarthrobacter ureafaciens]GLU67957.1 acetyl-coenzyme A synthetase [Paenarthrobacter ureafaciens]
MSQDTTGSTATAAPSAAGGQTRQDALENLLQENRKFAPSAEFAANAVVSADEYAKADADRPAFWANKARELLTWSKDFDQALDWSNPPFAKWFVGGEVNAAYNALDRHVENGLGDRVAIYFEGEPGDTRTYTYAELTEEVKKAANAFESLGVAKGDRVAVYLPMIPEAVITMLACARIGAVHSVVFGGFSADALRSRIEDAEAKLVVTADGTYRRGKPSPLKPAVDEALSAMENGDGHSVNNVVVVKRNGEDVNWVDGRDLWWSETVDKAPSEHTAVGHDSEHPLFILYTSGTTGKPKGILHTTGGYLTQTAYTHRAVFDLHPETDVYWCTADVGWVTGHSYVTYAPLINGATQVMYEGTPDSPHQGRWWEIAEKYKVSILYTAPTAIRTFMKWGREIPAKYDLSAIRVLGSVGEPINPEAWMWYREVIGGNGGKKANPAPIVDTWWQTETGAQMIAPLPGVTSTKPGSAQVPLPGIAVDVVDENGASVANGEGGYLVVREPWPSMLRGIWGDPERFKDTYWSRFEAMYFAGDGAKKDEDGDVWLLGRVDDVMNVSGHRLSTTEIESALVSHPAVAEAAVVGAADDTTGQAVVAFVILRGDATNKGDETVLELRNHVGKEIGPIAKPKQLLIVPELPKTRSGKIVRRLLKDIAEGRDTGDATTLADPSIMKQIAESLRK